MNKLMLILCLWAFSQFSMGMTVEGDENIVLNFDNNIDHILDKSFNGFLKVITEEVSFPNGRQKQRLFEAMELLEDIVNSEEFKRKVIGYVRPNGKREYSKNYLWNDSKIRLSNEQVYQLLMTGNEHMRPNTEGEINLNILKYHKFWSKVIGWTSPSSSKWIRVNWKFYKKYQVHEMVGNLIHEWIHLLGFLHGKEAPHEEVPYVVGRIASDIAKKKLDL